MSVPAYKEWAVVVRALLSGEQVLDARKGGIREEGRHFGLRSNRFWLYPTFEHQRPELVKPAYRRWVEETAGTTDDATIRVQGWAEVLGALRLDDPGTLHRIGSKLIWTPEYVESRLRWKARDPLWVLALRTHRLLEPIDVAWRPEYGGCTSWVELDGLPQHPTAVPSQPAVSEASLRSRIEMVERALDERFAPV